VVHVDLAESDNQLVLRYIGGMRQQFQDSLNLFDNVNVSKSHQMALHLKKTIQEVNGRSRGNIVATQTPQPIFAMFFHHLHIIERIEGKQMRNLIGWL
jgi:hypothetical protein